MKYLIWRINRTLSSSYTNIKYGIKSFIYWFLLIVRDRPWDYVYLLELEKQKLRQMLNYHKKYQRFEGVEFVIRDIALCVKLLDICIKEDIEPVEYINIRNASRFWALFLELPPSIQEEQKFWIRVEKAWALYNQIRYRNIWKWWD